MSAASGEIEVRVYYEDTDAAGIVYHASYLRFAERGRTELLRGLGVDHRTLAERHGIVFAVAACGLRFRAPARLDDLLVVRTRTREVGAVRLQLAQAVLRGEHVLCEIDVTLAVLAAEGLRPRRLPTLLREGFGATLGRS